MSQHGPRHPILSVAPERLHPTQLTVGRAEVAAKRAQWHALGGKKRKALIASHWFPGVLGPQGAVYIVDHHHFGLAMLLEGVERVPVIVQRDFSWLAPDTFWRTMEFNRWAHPYDDRGQRTDYAAIPSRLSELRDDPYRTLAARVREAGGCAKDATPYAEFLWADFFRARLKPAAVAKGGDKLLQRALLLAHGHDAGYLPGWSGLIE
ncbi:MAG: chromosome partitioning protein ParB [Lysobacter sp.]|nr:chromosome partitioning protein ParB [Lysobacter sp.]